MATRTPWGLSQGSTKFATGIICYDTAGHGGFHLSPSQNSKVPAPLRREDGWYEEDCEASKVYFSFPQLFPNQQEIAVKVLKDYFPSGYEKVTGQVIPLSESTTKARQAFELENASKYVVIAAKGDWYEGCPKGYVLTCATLGGKRSTYYDKISERFFYVKEEEYKQRSPYGFVINTLEHYEALNGF